MEKIIGSAAAASFILPKIKKINFGRELKLYYVKPY
jgi:hypothetical protein